MSQTLLSNFWNKVHKTPSCWLWLGHCSLKGYGQLQFSRRHWKAHRFSWELHNGPIPKGMLVCHVCDIPNCVNPQHLFLGTNSDNMRDAISKGRKPYRLTYEQVQLAKQLRSQGKTWKSLAKMFFVTPWYLSQLCQGKISTLYLQSFGKNAIVTIEGDK